MVGVANGKIQKSRTIEDMKTDSEFDANEVQAPAKTQSTKSSPPVQAVGTRNIMVCIIDSNLMRAYMLIAERRLTVKFTHDLT